MEKQKRSVSIASAMQILIEVMADRSEGVATNLSDKEFIEMLKMVCTRYFLLDHTIWDILRLTYDFLIKHYNQNIFLYYNRQNIDKKKIADAEEYFRQAGKRQSGILTFENLNTHDCPNLDNDE